MLNHITLMGRLTRDPELRYTKSNTPVASFSLAVERDIKDQDGERKTDFIDCVAWRQTGEFITKHFTKGRMAVVSGRLQFRIWEDKDKNSRRTAEVLVENVYFGDSKPEASRSNAGTGGANYADPGAMAPATGGYPDMTPNFAPTYDDGDFPF